MSFSKVLLPEFDQEMKNTRRILECVPDGKFDYQPHEKSMTLGRLATHVAEMAGWAKTTMETELLEMDAGFKPHIATSRVELLQIFDKGVADSREKISAASDEDWKKIWTFKYAGQTYISEPRSAVMRGSVLNHMIHHRAQLGVYLRLNNVAFPGMYGPSADEQQFQLAQAG
jgi:uncharacterized damage-inducible protein DinB